jgi:hypothetical protein
MTIFATPGGTPLNQAGGFQGTQPGNAIGATLQTVQPGVGLFPPNSNNQSGDTILASISRGATPANVEVNNFGVTTNSGGGPGVAGGRSVLATQADAQAAGTGSGFTVLSGGSSNNGPAGRAVDGVAAGGDRLRLHRPIWRLIEQRPRRRQHRQRLGRRHEPDQRPRQRPGLDTARQRAVVGTSHLRRARVPRLGP